MTECSHSIVNDGPRIPLAWGSAATQICLDCGKWRQDRPGCHGEWRDPAELAESFMDDNEAYRRKDAA